MACAGQGIISPGEFITSIRVFKNNIPVQANLAEELFTEDLTETELSSGPDPFGRHFQCTTFRKFVMLKYNYVVLVQSLIQ